MKDAKSQYCRYDSDIATGLGVGSLLFLLASQLLIVAVSRCLCCGKGLRPSGARTWAIILFITSWYVLIQNSTFPYLETGVGLLLKHRFTML